MPIDIYKLSFTVQLALGSGYLAYLIAYAGIRQHHTAADAVMRAFAFGIIASAMMTYGYQVKGWTALVAFTLTIAAGVCWRWFGMAAWRKILRVSRINASDDIPTAWVSVTAVEGASSPSQIVVEMIDGRILMCEDTRDFGDAHEGPVTLGLAGDVALYVTAEWRPDGTSVEKQDVRHLDGDLMTYVPASQIKRVDLRYFNEKVSRAAGKAVAAAGEVEGQAEPSPAHK